MGIRKKGNNFSWIELLKSLWFFLGYKRKKFLLLNILLFTINLYDLVPILIIGLIVDFFVKYSVNELSLTKFYYYVALLSGTYIIAAAIRLGTKRKLAELSFDTLYSVKIKAFQSLTNQSLAWHQKENSGNKIQRINTGGQSLFRLIKLFENGIFDILSAYIGVIVILFIINVKFSLFVIIYLLLFLVIQILFYNKQKYIVNKLNKFKERASGKFYESLSNILSIKALGANKSFEQNIIHQEDNVRQTGHERSKIMINKWTVFQIFNGIALLFFLLLIGEGVAKGAVTIGSIVIFFSYFQKLSSSSGNATHKFDELVQIKENVARMMPIFDKLKDENRDKPFPADWDKIRISNAKFQYSKDANSFFLSCNNVEVKKGDHVWIIGESGSGKSTFLKILLSLHSFNQGVFKIGSTNFNDINKEDIFENISIVLQESELFNMSLKDNIILFQRLNKSQFNKVVKTAQLESVIKKLPNGINTIIGEKGFKLSGGERQRIGIARALYKNPEIILFDEATSNLDTKTELKVLESIKNNFHNKTLLSITHRIHIFKKNDYLYIFDKGRIAESGNYVNLMNMPNSLIHSFKKEK